MFLNFDVTSGAMEAYTKARGVEILSGGIIGNSFRVGHVQRYSTYNINTLSYPVKTRNINITIFGGTLSSFKMTANGYRRIGTNS